MTPGSAGLFFLLARNRLKTAAVLIECGQDETDSQLHTGLEILQAGDAADFRGYLGKTDKYRPGFIGQGGF